MSVQGKLDKLRSEIDQLVTRHDSDRSLRDFSIYEKDPAGFMRDVLRSSPIDVQVSMAEAVRDNQRTVVVTANGLGKDWATARIALWWVYACRGLVVLQGPTERQVRGILMREIRRAFTAVPELPGDLFSMELRVDGEVRILAFTSDNAEKLVGFHHPRLLVAFTEGQGIVDEAYEAALACCTGPENRLFVYGNPTAIGGPFYRAATSATWKTLTLRADQHPNVISGRQEIPGAVSREWIQMMRDEYGEGSAMYRSRVLAEFPEDNLEGLVRREWIRAAFDRFESGEMGEDAERRPPVLALDVARFGPDKSVLAIVTGPVVRELIAWQRLSITETVDRVIEHGQRVRAADRRRRKPVIHVDEPGLGGGAIDLLRQKGWIVEAFNGAHTPFDAARFLNKRSETHWALRSLLENNQVAIPRDPLLEEELLAVEWQINPKGLIQIVAKETMRTALGRSPDRLDAVVIGLSATAAHFKRPSVAFSSFDL